MGRKIIKTKQIEVQPYGACVTFIYSNSYKEVVKYAIKDNVNEADVLRLTKEDYEGYHMPLIDKDNVKEYYLVVMKHGNKYQEIDTITHEMMHLVGDILNSVGIKYSLKNDETYAYLMGHLNKEFFKFKDGK